MGKKRETAGHCFMLGFYLHKNGKPNGQDRGKLHKNCVYMMVYRDQALHNMSPCCAFEHLALFLFGTCPLSLCKRLISAKLPSCRGVLFDDWRVAYRDRKRIQRKIALQRKHESLRGLPTPVQLSLRVQVYNNHILTQKVYYSYYYPKPKYLIIGYMDPLGMGMLE